MAAAVLLRDDFRRACSAKAREGHEGRGAGAPTVNRHGIGTPDRLPKGGLIPTCPDHHPWAHFRIPMDMIFHGRSTRLFQASQQSATMSW
jgi:hypothetical protein